MTPCNRVKKNAVESSKELLIHPYNRNCRFQKQAQNFEGLLYTLPLKAMSTCQAITTVFEFLILTTLNLKRVSNIQ